MQVQDAPRFRTSLKQGSIFSLEDLSFTDPEDPKKTYSLKDFYPMLTLEGVKHGIVLSQSCDLYRDGKRAEKLSHIMVGFLEPFGAYIGRMALDWNKSIVRWRNPDDPNEWTLLYLKAMESPVKKELKDLLQNNLKFGFFISFMNELVEDRYFIVNLTRTVPLRAVHYGGLLRQVTCELTTEFENKLGWKLAELYGRVGTTDYADSELNEIVVDLLDVALPNAVPQQGTTLRVSKDQFERARAIAADKRAVATKERLFLEIVASQPTKAEASEAVEHVRLAPPSRRLTFADGPDPVW